MQRIACTFFVCHDGAMRTPVSPERFPSALRRLGVHVENAVHEAFVRVARSGKLYAERLTRTRKARAFGTYLASWRVEEHGKSVALANLSRHSIFVERGRDPGKPPPLLPIVEWVLIKGMAGRRRPRVGKMPAGGGDGRVARGGAKRAKARASKFTRRIDAVQLAQMIRMKIAKKGTEGYGIMRDTRLRMARLAPIEVRRSVARALRRPPR